MNTPSGNSKKAAPNHLTHSEKTDITSAVKRRFRAIGHTLGPVVTVSDKGVSNGVIGETLRALSDHELIKVRFVMGDRKLKKNAINELCRTTQAALIQTIGNIALIYRKNPDGKPKHSNI